MAKPTDEHHELSQGLGDVARQATGEVIQAASEASGSKTPRYVITVGAACMGTVVVLATLDAPAVAYLVLLVVFIAILGAGRHIGRNGRQATAHGAPELPKDDDTMD